MKRVFVALVIAASALVVAQTAGAHTGKISADCSAVTFTFASFPSGSSTISYVIKVDGTQTQAGSFAITGPAAVVSIPNKLAPGTHSVYAKATWGADGGGFAEGTASVSCAAPPPVCPEGTDKISDNPLVCQKTVYVDRPVEKIVYVDRPVEKVVYVDKPYWTPCPSDTTTEPTQDGGHICVAVTTKTVTQFVTRTKTIVKTKVHVRTVVKYRPCPKKPKPPACPTGLVRFHSASGWKCGVPGSG